MTLYISIVTYSMRMPCMHAYKFLYHVLMAALSLPILVLWCRCVDVYVFWHLFMYVSVYACTYLCIHAIYVCVHACKALQSKRRIANYVYTYM
jgi:hypothetical protein